ncbi:MAG: ImmA/IrrE family metallo-endopeptidase [Deltaproteobacteria bacterium]|nr:ImmA/IrrE family metallo-endopeptidase [Deltaproteobacteria bacterium]
MASQFNAKLLLLARQARGLNQLELSERTGIDQGLLSKIENGLREPKAEVIKRLSDELGFPQTFFHQSDRIYGLPVSVHASHRKKCSVGIRQLDYIHAELNIRLWNLKKLLQSVELTPKMPIPHFDIDEYKGDVEQVATLVRRFWLLPRGPIENLTDCLERAGCVIFWCDFPNIAIDGITIATIPEMPVCIFLNKDRPADRMRFTLAHELGHIVMHRIPHPEMEEQANHFAAAFLMPYFDIKEQFGMIGNRITLEKLAYLKPIWRVAMQALLMRAKDTGIISKNQSDYLWKQISIAKIRLQEPPELDFPHEEPKTLKTVLKLHFEELGYTISELAEALYLHESEFRKKYDIDKSPPRRKHLRVLYDNSQ